MTFDGIKLGQDIVELTRAYVDKQLAPLRERIAELESKGISYKGVWQRADIYRRGDIVTEAGSAWCCVKDGTTDRPGTSDSFQLMVKRGADAAPSKTPGLA